MENKGIDCLLINPRQHGDVKYPPISLIALAAYAREKGFAVDILDASALLCDDSAVLAKIEQAAPKSIGLTFMTPQFAYVQKLVGAIRERFPKLLQFAGGTHANAVPELSLRQLPALDFLVLGEGERTFVEILEHIRQQGAPRLEAIKGVAYLKNGEFTKTEPRELIENLDELPMPAWDLLPINEYQVSQPASRYEYSEGIALTISGSRGCPYNCIFCASHSVFPRGRRFRSAKLVVDELEFLYKKYGVRHYFFVDEVLFHKPEAITALANEIIARELPLVWAGNSRVDAPALRDDILELVKRAGCVRIDFGVETGSARMLKDIRKGITLEQIYRAHRMAHKHDLATTTLMMVGHPHESYEDFLDSIRLVAQLESDYPEFGPATPFPDTELYKIADTSGWLCSHDWSEYTISNTYRVMRSEHFDYDEILELSLVGNAAGQIFGELAKYKRYLPEKTKSLAGRFRAFRDALSRPMAVYVGAKQAAEFAKLFIYKDASPEKFERVLSRLNLRKKRIELPAEVGVIVRCAAPGLISFVDSLAARSGRKITVFASESDAAKVKESCKSDIVFESVERNLIRHSAAWAKAAPSGNRAIIYGFDTIKFGPRIPRLVADGLRVLRLCFIPSSYLTYYRQAIDRPWDLLVQKIRQRIPKSISTAVWLRALRLAMMSGNGAFTTPPSEYVPPQQKTSEAT